VAAIRRVGVVGAGLAGLAAALAAARAGAQVDLFEAQPEPASPAAHIDVVPNLLRDLATLDLAEGCVRRGFPYSGFAVIDGDGRALFDVPTPHLAGPQWPAALGMVYGDLLGLVREAALASGVRLHLGAAVRDANDCGAIVIEGGDRHAVDLAVIAAGDRLPALAGAAPRPVPDVALPQQWCHALLPRPRTLERATWVIGSPSLRAMVVPVDARRAGVAVLQPAAALPSAATLRTALQGQGHWLRALAEHWPDDAPVLLRPVSSGVLAGAWHEQGVLRIGRSAHRLTPYFGQAAAQAVEDAVVLGALLGEGHDRAALLETFMARRGERARRVHAVTTQAAQWQLQPEAATDLRGLAEQLAPLVAEPA
jgi:2-polyprenyl-6-methoxyphenol hydroxylase-like FAD-dependent oxidoreductase